jgi:hypothetical protein
MVKTCFFVRSICLFWSYRYFPSRRSSKKIGYWPCGPTFSIRACLPQNPVVEKVIFPTQMAILVHYFWTNLIPSLSIKTTMVTTGDPQKKLRNPDPALTAWPSGVTDLPSSSSQSFGLIAQLVLLLLGNAAC